MEAEYDLFETVKEEPHWRCTVVGILAAIERLKELGATTKNELCIIHVPTKSLIAILDGANPAKAMAN